MRIGIDLDGCVADHVEGIIQIYNRLYKTKFTADIVQEWDFLFRLPKIKDWKHYWKWAKRHSLYSVMPGVPLAPSVIRRLSRKHDIVFITARPDWTAKATSAWLARRGLGHIDVVHNESKWAESCDVYVDDSPQNLLDLTRRKPNAKIIRMVRPWNKPLKRAEDAETWPEIEEIIDKLEREKNNVVLS